MELHRKQTAQRQQDARRFQDYAALAAPSLRHQPLSELRGILLEVCDELDIPEPEFVNPAVLKKWATGDGHATKTQMVAACKDRYGIVPVDDNAADACHLFYYYIRRHRL
jgi:hypothetical protein